MVRRSHSNWTHAGSALPTASRIRTTQGQSTVPERTIACASETHRHDARARDRLAWTSTYARVEAGSGVHQPSGVFVADIQTVDSSAAGTSPNSVLCTR